VWGLIASLYVGNVMLLVLNLPLVGIWIKLLRIPRPQLYAGILIFGTIGVYGMRQSVFDLFLLWVIGVVGVLMRRFDFPIAPVIVGMILGPISEKNLLRALEIAQGDWTVFVRQPICLTLLVVTLLVLVLPRIMRRRGLVLGEDD
jgi:putative tricarboxylic transport membrane protein